MFFEPNLSIKRSVTIDTKVYFGSDGDGHGYGEGTYRTCFEKTRFNSMILLPDLPEKQVRDCV